MNWSKWIRQIHRWVAVIFTLLVIFVMVASLGAEEPAEWVYLSPLPALFLLLLTGLYLFVLPHAARWRGSRGGA